MGEISCSIDFVSAHHPDKPHVVRSKERPIPSIRKMFILSGYARAGVDPNKQSVSISTQSCKAEQFFVSSVEGRRGQRLLGK
jgi:hypothetical protein